MKRIERRARKFSNEKRHNKEEYVRENIGLYRIHNPYSV